MHQKPYAAYSAEEFALDDLFVRWVKHPDDEEVVAYWEQWLRNNPACAETVDTARILVETGSRPMLPSLTTDEISTVWGRIRESLETMEDVRPLQPDVRAVVGWWYFFRTVAATLGLILLVGWALWMQYGPEQSVQVVRTNTGQTRRVRLPDNSTVTLHPNSVVRFARCWNDESPRAVWLQGEADFAVVHRPDTSSSRLFRVHTADLTIEAVGTTFRVRQRPKGTRVALRSGQVNLLISQQQSIRLQPGDSVEVAGGSIQALP
ncbi:ferric-dicitrate binding protein FerR (iron transport regulator) [Spirosoma lacussanchae]|uniref:FecR family protein n=1 Tax=Spirosoma lacussanchae TaxID=1884249 RepID=UPI00110970AB|nr:FecR family protein [Spirosoma lacussanchae]